MLLPSGGIDIWYIDESGDKDRVAATAVSVPFLRPENRNWRFLWNDYFEAARKWRRLAKAKHRIPVQKELHAWKLISGRGQYRDNKMRFGRRAAAGVYRWLLSELHFLQEMSIITVTATGTSELYGHSRLQAAMFALFQRMQRASDANKRAGMTFFDEGHGEYRKLYRKARVYLPTGSMLGDWGGTTTRNKPMEAFVKDANFKDSRHSVFIQIDDLVSYAAFLKVKGESNGLTKWQADNGLGSAYDAIPHTVLNTKAARRDPQGVVRLRPKSGPPS